MEPPEPIDNDNASRRRPSPLRAHPMGGKASYRIEQMSAMADDTHPVFHPGRVAVITGAASGIGRAAAKELAKIGLKIALADISEANLAIVAKEIAAIIGEANLLVVPTDVSKVEQVVALRDKVYENWGEVAVLLNNAGTGSPKGTSWSGLDAWRNVFDVNVFGILNVQQTFVPSMRYQENSAVIINTGSKQGITNPPGNPAYNASKAAIKSLTESLSYELREQKKGSDGVTAHLMIPGWTFTGMTGNNPSQTAEKPAGAWSAEQTIQYTFEKVRLGDFYILVPDNDTTNELDHLRMMWSAGDIAEGRPALSRWHPDYKSLFAEYIREGLANSS